MVLGNMDIGISTANLAGIVVILMLAGFGQQEPMITVLPV